MGCWFWTCQAAPSSLRCPLVGDMLKLNHHGLTVGIVSDMISAAPTSLLLLR